MVCRRRRRSQPDESPAAAELAAFLEQLRALGLKPCEAVPWARFSKHVLRVYATACATGKPAAPATMAKVRQVLRDVGELLGPEGTTAGLTTDLVMRYMDHPSRVQNTKASLNSTLRAICTIAVDEGWLLRSPFKIRKGLVAREEPEGKQYLEEWEVAAIFELMEKEMEGKTGWALWRAHRLFVACVLLAYTGARKREILELRIEHVHLDRGIIDMPRRTGRRSLKTAKSAQPLPIPDRALPILARWIEVVKGPLPLVTGTGFHGRMRTLALSKPPDPGWLFPNCFGTGPWVGGSKGYTPLDRFKAVAKRAGVPNAKLKWYRHTFATLSEKWGIKELMLQRLLRHTTPVTQKCYRHPDEQNMRAAVRDIGFGPPPGEPAGPSASVA